MNLIFGGLEVLKLFTNVKCFDISSVGKSLDRLVFSVREADVESV